MVNPNLLLRRNHVQTHFGNIFAYVQAMMRKIYRLLIGWPVEKNKKKVEVCVGRDCMDMVEDSKHGIFRFFEVDMFPNFYISCILILVCILIRSLCQLPRPHFV